MAARTPRRRLAPLLTAIGFALGLGLGCAGVLAQPGGYDYFAMPDSHDAWSRKIAGWQHRERAEDDLVLAAVPEVAEAGDAADVPPAPASTVDGEPGAPQVALRDKYFGFRAERRRSMAREFADWIQQQAKRHYVPDGPIDHWATLEETLQGDGDDCDGLELLVFHGLRDLGFSSSEVYRSIVYRPSDGQHHMVTLWFEEDSDPWVIDPTGAMVKGMRRMSEVPGWVPLKVFSDTTEFTVRSDQHLTRGQLAARP